MDWLLGGLEKVERGDHEGKEGEPAEMHRTALPVSSNNVFYS